MKRAYIDGRYGQVHLIDAPAPHSARPLLVCLHATAYSSRSLTPLVEAFEADRHVAALDTPGYGGSDAPPRPITVEDYADALAESLMMLSPARPVDIFGYHTGITIAIETALRHPGRVRRIAMIGVPFFSGPDQPEWESKLLVRHALGGTLDQFEERWNYLVANRGGGLTLERGFANFVDELRAWPNGWWAHQALFRHDLTSRLPALDIPALVINPASALSEVSRAAAALMPDVQLIERPDMSGAIFERYPAEIARLVRGFLDN